MRRYLRALSIAGLALVCTVATTAADCTASAGNFGKLTGTRAPREIQLGVKFFWN